MVDPASKLLAEAFNLGHLEIEFVGERRGANASVPPQVVLKARVGGVLVRLHFIQMPDLVPIARAVTA